MAKKNKTAGKRFHRRNILLIGIVTTLICACISYIGLFSGLEKRSIDWRFNIRGQIEPTVPVVIVAIDENSLKHMPERWAWPRSYYAKAVENLKKWGAKAIGFDIFFSEVTEKNPKQDKAFAEAIKKDGNVVLGVGFNFDVGKRYAMTTPVLPIEELKNSAAGMGIIHHVIDDDSSIRNAYMLLDFHEKRYISFGLKLLGEYYNMDTAKLTVNKKELDWGKFKIPLVNDGQMIINFAGFPKSFKTISFYDVYFGKTQKDIFKDKIVLIGATADELHDVFPTPFHMERAIEQTTLAMPGVEVHANVINTIYNGIYIRDMGWRAGFLMLLIIGILTSFAIFNIKSWQGLLVVAAEIALYIAAAIFLFNNYRYIIHLISPVATILLCYLSITAYKVAVEEREKHEIRSTFSRYVSESIVNEILKKGEIKLGGQKQELTVLFSDIRGFTSMSEKLAPEEVVHTLNEFLSAMTDIIFRNNGTLDKFMGDAVMAVFGSPVFYKDHALCAVRAAFMMKGKLNELNEKWKKQGRPPLAIGIGINTGEAIAGNMGSIRRMEYTVIGDTVNLASRLESLNKELNTEILISESTYMAVKGNVNAKEYTGIKVKGKEKNIKVYEAIEFKP